MAERWGDEVVKLSKTIETKVPTHPSISYREEEFHFTKLRVDYQNKVIRAVFANAFFKELVDAYMEEYKEGVRPRVTVAIINGELGIVGGSGRILLQSLDSFEGTKPIATHALLRLLQTTISGTFRRSKPPLREATAPTARSLPRPSGLASRSSTEAYSTSTTCRTSSKESRSVASSVKQARERLQSSYCLKPSLGTSWAFGSPAAPAGMTACIRIDFQPLGTLTAKSLGLISMFVQVCDRS